MHGYSRQCMRVKMCRPFLRQQGFALFKQLGFLQKRNSLFSISADMKWRRCWIVWNCLRAGINACGMAATRKAGPW